MWEAVCPFGWWYKFKLWLSFLYWYRDLKWWPWFCDWQLLSRNVYLFISPKCQVTFLTGLEVGSCRIVRHGWGMHPCLWRSGDFGPSNQNIVGKFHCHCSNIRFPFIFGLHLWRFSDRLFRRILSIHYSFFWDWLLGWNCPHPQYWVPWSICWGGMGTLRGRIQTS